MFQTKLFLSGLILTLIMLAGCSGNGTNPTVPAKDTAPLPALSEADTIGHNLAGFWLADFDLGNMTAEIIPQRFPDLHYRTSVKLTIVITGWNSTTGVLDLDVIIKNTTGYDVYDLRLIIYTDDIGHMLLYPDGWTPLFDLTGGSSINPFKAYAKGEINRKFAANASYTEHLKIYFPDKKLTPVTIRWGVEASFPGNCTEPYSIAKLAQTDNKVDVEVLDWQNDVNRVLMIAPNITGDLFDDFSYQSGNTWTVTIANNMGVSAGDYNVLIAALSAGSASLPLYNYITVHVNATQLTVGEITGAIGLYEETCANYSIQASGDTGITYHWTCNPPSAGYFTLPNASNTDFCAYAVDLDTQVTLQVSVDSDNSSPVQKSKIVNISNGDQVFSPSNETPAWLAFSAQEIFTSGVYAYVAAGTNGLYIFNISDPLHPRWVSNIDTAGNAIGVYVSGEYAYVADEAKGVEIIDVTPPETPSFVKNWNTSKDSNDVVVLNGYGYVADGSYGLRIYDLATDILLKTVDTPSDAVGLKISNGSAFVADGSSGQFQIIDVDPPETAGITKQVSIPGGARAVDISNGYAYVASSSSGINIIDIDPPESAYLYNTLDTPNITNDIYILGNLAYVADSSTLLIINLDTYSVIKSLSTSAIDVVVSNGYAYVTQYDAGYQVIDVEPPDTAFIVKQVDNPDSPGGLTVIGNYLYVWDSDDGLFIFKILSPSNIQLLGSCDTAGTANDAFISGDYAFLADGSDGLVIIDINPPEVMSIVKTFDTPGTARGISISNNYAYIADDNNGVVVVDISSISSPAIVKTVNNPLPNSAQKITISGNYAYVANGSSGLRIIDITDPPNSYVYKEMDTSGTALDVQVSGNFAYVADGSSGLQIIQIDPLNIKKSVDTSGTPCAVFLSGGYAYLAEGISYSNLVFMDISPVDLSHIVANYSVSGAMDVFVAGNYAYVCAYDSANSLKIIKLW